MFYSRKQVMGQEKKQQQDEDIKKGILIKQDQRL